MIDHKISKGMSTIYTREISTTDTAVGFGTGVLDYLLSTPAIVSMIIEGSIKLLDHLVPENFITVSGKVEVSHEKPTLLGESVHIVLTVEEVNGDRVILDAVIHDHVGVVARGKHERIIVNSEKLIAHAYLRLGRDMNI